MRRVVVLVVAISASRFATGQSSAKQTPKNSPISQLERVTSSGPVFIENVGQFDPQVKFQVKIKSQSVWLTSSGIAFDAIRPVAVDKAVTANSVSDPRGTAIPTASRLVFSEDFLGARCCMKVEGMNQAPGMYNYFQGNDSTKWRTNVRGYSEVVYHDVWPGVDLRVYGKGSDLEQEFLVRPGGDLRNVQISFRGIDQLTLAKDGSLEVATAFGTLRETRPSVYQELSGGRRITVNGAYELLSKNAYSFKTGDHDPLYPLVVDPTLLYSTFLGGSAGNRVDNYTNEYATGIAVDALGSTYVAGYTLSTDFPTTVGTFQTSPASGSFITKLNATGSALIYSTYLGNSTQIAAIAVDTSGDVFVAGVVNTSVPVTANAYWPQGSSACGNNFFLTKLNPAGNGLLYSSCLNNGSAYGALYGLAPHAIAVDGLGHAFVAGSTSTTMPTSPNAYQSSNPGGQGAAFVMGFDTTASGSASLVYSTFFGVSNSFSNYYGSNAKGIALDSSNNIYITGWAGPNLPVTAGAFQISPSGGGNCNPSSGAEVPCPDVFIAKLNPSISGAQQLIYSTYLGGPAPPGNGYPGNGSGNAIVVDSSGNVYVTGQTYSSTFPVTPGAFQTTGVSTLSAFVSKMDAGGAHLVYSTYLNGHSQSSGNAIAVDSFGDAYVAGNFRAGGFPNVSFPVTPDAFQSSFTKLSGDSQEAFLTKLNPSGSGLIYSSYLGGNGDDVATSVAIDQTGDAYVAGYTGSPNFPVAGAAFQSVVHGTGDAFVTKFPLADTFRLLGLSISRGGNVGQVSPTIFGSGFHSGCTATLIGGSNVQATQVTVGPVGRSLSTTFDLTGIAPGVYSVSVTNADGSTLLLPNSFTVEQGGTSNVWLDLVGRSAMRGGVQQLYTIEVGNSGTADRAPFRFWVSFPSFLVYTSLSGSPPSIVGTKGQTSYLAFDVPRVPAGATVPFVLGLTLPDAPGYGHLTFQVQVWKDGQ